MRHHGVDEVTLTMLGARPRDRAGERMPGPPDALEAAITDGKVRAKSCSS
jgi:hypothetical protein